MRKNKINNALYISNGTEKIYTIEELQRLQNINKLELDLIIDNLYCTTCQINRTPLTYRKFRDSSRSCLSTYRGFEHDEECSIEKNVYNQKTIEKYIKINPDMILNKLENILKQKSSENKIGINKRNKQNSYIEKEKVNQKNLSISNKIQLLEKKIDNITDYYLNTHENLSVIFYGEIRVVEKVQVSGKLYIYKIETKNGVKIDLKVLASIDKYIIINNVLKVDNIFRKTSFLANINFSEWNGKKYYQLFILNSKFIYEV